MLDCAGPLPLGKAKRTKKGELMNTMPLHGKVLKTAQRGPGGRKHPEEKLPLD